MSSLSMSTLNLFSIKYLHSSDCKNVSFCRLLEDKQETEWEEKPLPQTPSKERVTPESYVDPTELTPPPFASKNRGFSLHTPADVALKPSDTPFARRVHKFTVQFTFNDHLSLESSEEAASNTDGDDILKRLKPVRRCEIDVLGTGPEPGTRYMFDQIENRVSFCRLIVDLFSYQLEKAHYSLSYSRKPDGLLGDWTPSLAQWTSGYKILPRFLKIDYIVRWMIMWLLPLRCTPSFSVLCILPESVG